MGFRAALMRAGLVATVWAVAACGGNSERSGNTFDGQGWRFNIDPPLATIAAGTTGTVRVTLECTTPLDAELELSQTFEASFARRDLELDARLGLGTSLPLPCTPAAPAVADISITVRPEAAAGSRFVRLELLSGPLEQLLDEFDLRVAVSGSSTPSPPGTNLIANPGFEDLTAAGGLPAATGFWQGDAHLTVAAENDIAPREGIRMLKFVATGATGSTNTVASQLWQSVDMSAYAAEIAAQRARVEGAAWFNRVIQGSGTDRRFDVRLIAFAGPPSELAARYAAGNWLAAVAQSVDTAGFQWQEARTSLTLPVGTTYVLFEIYAFEDVRNDDGSAAEFDGHYADDVSLVLTILP